MLLLAAVPATAQPLAPDSVQSAVSAAPTPIERLRTNPAGGRTSDLLGQRVRVRGWMTVGQGALRRNGRLYAYVQDATGGIRLDGAFPVQVDEGTAVEVTGTLMNAAGELALRVDGLEQRPVRPYRPAPVAMHTLRQADTLMGRVVRVRGIVASLRPIPVGEALGLLVGDSLVYAVRYRDAPHAYDFSALVPGQQVEVTGVLGQFRTAMQVYPRSGADVSPVGLRPGLYRVVALVSVGMLLLALAWAIHLVRVGRKRLAALTATQRHFHLLFSKAETGVVVAEPGPESLRILRANPAALRLVGFDRRQAGDDYSNVHLGDYILQGSDAIGQHLSALATRGRNRADVQMRGPHGDVRDVTIESYSVQEDEGTLYFSFLHDITQRMAHERALVEARERAENFARMQSTFLRNMSHELRTPLAGIIGFAEVLRSELDGESQQFARYIEQGGRRLLATLQDVLDLTRWSSGNAVLDVEPCDAAALVQALGQRHTADAADAGILLEVSTPPEAAIEQDPKAIDRVLGHLLANALKFTSAGGSVALRLDGSSPSEVQFTVEDTGIGMSESFQERLFTLYAQESSGYARSHEGVGIGLHLVRTLVQEMHGTVRVESARGVGTTVTVTLPRVHPSYAPAPALAPGAPSEVA